MKYGAVAPAGLIMGMLLAESPAAIAGPPTECWTKIECAQIAIDNTVCADLCHFKTNCGTFVRSVWVAFRVEETSPNGYDDLTIWDSEICVTQQKCRKKANVECDGNPEENVCENDGAVQTIYAYDQGFFGDEC